MLRPLFTSGPVPGTFPVDPTVKFEAGQIGGLIIIGGDIFVTVSDGVNVQPMGIIDDIKTEVFTKRQIDEIVIIPSTGVPASEFFGYGYGNIPSDTLVSPVSVTGFLEFSNISTSSFVSTVAVMLNPINGTITVPAGTPLNFQDDEGNLGFEVQVSYTYSVADLPGQDTTRGSGNVSLHIFRGLYSTDQFDPSADYPLNATLYAGPEGQLTTRVNGPAIGMVTSPPSVANAEIQFLFF